jgi:hypothetical protein
MSAHDERRTGAARTTASQANTRRAGEEQKQQRKSREKTKVKSSRVGRVGGDLDSLEKRFPLIPFASTP